MNRKIRKLLNNPRLFVSDMVAKRLARAGGIQKQTSTLLGHYRYSVVSAVYGAAPYLDAFFESLVNQTLDFCRHIELIMVDDSSIDGSAEIIQRWQKQYPGNIRYVRQENAGQGAARNAGIPLASGDWITFIDPDDFVNRTYFAAIDRFLSQRRANRVALLCCNLLVYREDRQRTSNDHPLAWRFSKGDLIVPAARPGRHFQSSVATAFFRRNLIRSSGIQFDTRIRPNFEDGHFVGRYLLEAQGLDIGFAADAHYYYRKRVDGTSTMDQSITDPQRYDAVPRYGYEGLLAAARERLGTVPEWTQRMVLYSLFWQFKYLINSPDRLDFLEPSQRQAFASQLHRVFEWIDPATILEFELATPRYYYAAGWLGTYKKGTPLPRLVFLDRFDATKRLLRARYFYRDNVPFERFSLDGRDVIPAYAKSRTDDVLAEEFVSQRILWLPVSDEREVLSIELGHQPVHIGIKDKRPRATVRVREILAALRPKPVKEGDLPVLDRRLRRLARSTRVASRYRDAWLFMDRDMQADDNAEHLYRHVTQCRPDINAFFILRRDAPDWGRLNSEGFRLLEFDSENHRLALLNASHLMSSHADQYVYGLLPAARFRDMLRFRFTFLRHGLSHNDLSGWLNDKPIDCLVTTSNAETQAMLADGSHDAFTRKEIVQSGIPRHDALLNSTVPSEKLVLIMPSWRKQSVGKAAGAGCARLENSSFSESEFAQRWKHLLHSERLRALCKALGYRIIFAPHINVRPYLKWFEVPRTIQVSDPSSGDSIQVLFRRAGVLLTDYSSVAFELALIDKPMVYYQFDEAEMFGGGHTMRRGYFDYRRDGFGPVCVSEEETLAALEAILQRNCVNDVEYSKRAQLFFSRRDGRNCQRTFEAILRLDAPDWSDDQSEALLTEYAVRASEERAWGLALARWTRVVHARQGQPGTEALVRLAEAACQSRRPEEAEEALGQVDPSDAGTMSVRVQKAELASAAGQWAKAAELWVDVLADAPGDDDLLKARAAARLAESFRCRGDLENAARALARAPSGIHESETTRQAALLARDQNRASEAVAIWQTFVEKLEGEPPPEVRLSLAEAYHAAGDIPEAVHTLDVYLAAAGTRATTHARLFRLEMLATQRVPLDRATKAELARLASAAPEPSEALRLVRILRQFGLLDDAETLLDAMSPSADGLSSEVWLERAALLNARQDWAQLIAMDDMSALGAKEPERLQVRVAVASAYHHVGQHDTARLRLERLAQEYPDAPEVLAALGESCHATADWTRAIACWSALRDRYPTFEADRVRTRLVQAFDATGNTAGARRLLSSHARLLALQKLQDSPNDLGLITGILQSYEADGGPVTHDQDPETSAVAAGGSDS
ncbi:MAG: CDP-glycerol glycerophosphotransferase family protein [Polyangiaceae bacterium]|nr:CDP-glycerol glycerophosphotransferase family protein [Polyangiaceae bacterium]